ncbi:hypothetical protein [Marinobacter zhejiangensis]|uniref:hypothetical protein n=1 Tax=Marinobacter zhejiangensis TaxID=488535 RepID=UPI0011138379|nr:hypothetical protein [Marinobacter zhejiangensis]
MTRFLASVVLITISGDALARGRSYCSSEAFEENCSFIAFWLGFVGIYFILYGRHEVKACPKLTFCLGWFAMAIVAMMFALVFQADVLELRNAWGLAIVAITGYGVFGYGLSRPLKKI